MPIITRMTIWHLSILLLLWDILINHVDAAALTSIGDDDAHEQGGKVRVLYGSCHSSKLGTPLWDHILSRKPHLWIFGGDNMYADRMKALEELIWSGLVEFKLPFEKATAKDLEASYKTLHAVPGYKQLFESVPQIAIWDDHDYGINDGDKTYPLREASKEVFLREMVKAPKDDPRWTQKGGIYTAQTFHVKGTDQTFRVIALDVRFSKDPWSVPKDRGDMLGDEQWQWLEKELCDDSQRPRVNLILSGLQVLIDNRGAGESWSIFPKQRDRLFKLLKRCKVRAPLILSGDVHMAEIHELGCGKGEQLAEITSSGMTHSWGTRAPGWTGEMLAFNLFLKYLMEASQQVMPWNTRSTRAEGADKRTGAYFLGLNFAEIDLDFVKGTVTGEIIDRDNRAALKQTWTFEELDLDRPDTGDADGFICEAYRGNPNTLHLLAARVLVVSVFFLLPIGTLVLAPFLLMRNFYHFMLRKW